jgi:hypothetical protein
MMRFCVIAVLLVVASIGLPIRPEILPTHELVITDAGSPAPWSALLPESCSIELLCVGTNGPVLVLTSRLRFVPFAAANSNVCSDLRTLQSQHMRLQV